MGPQLFVFVIFSGFCSSALGQEAPTTEPCLTSQENCSVATSSVSIINNNYFCCKTGYSMSMINTFCTCKKTSNVRDCGQGPKACIGATSFSSDGNGNTWCCPRGYSMASFSGFANGQFQRTCKCTMPLAMAGNGGSSVFISGNGGVVIGGVPGNFNVTDYEQRMRDWGLRFANRMSAMSASLQRNLGNMFRNLGIFG